MKTVLGLPKELWDNRKLIWNLAKNDFKTKYAGSYLGIIWAFVQPIVTIMVYWFVFGLALRSSSPRPVPFVLWLVAGLIPWFFVQDGWMNGTQALLSYNYLVKKVVFKINILPVVKLLSAFFVHAFFIAVIILLYAANGYFPDLYYLQLLYYVFCLFVLLIGVSYLTSAVVVFFRDLLQVINIVLQVGVWITPIMWGFEDLGLSGILTTILKLNPIYYIVSGYRDCLVYKVWFWEHPLLTLYFWVFTIIILVFGIKSFEKLKVHFADVL